MRVGWSLMVVPLSVLFAAACSGGGGNDGGGPGTGNSADAEKTAAAALQNMRSPMALHLTPDGRVVVAEAGTGANDGRVSVMSSAGSSITVVMDGLPSVAGSGEPWGDVAGVTGAAMAPDGVVCAAIGIPKSTGNPVSQLACSDGLTVDLAAWEQQNDPDALGPASRAFDVVADEDAGWWVSDAAGNTVVRVDRQGSVTLAGVFPTFGTFRTPTEGRPLGLFLAGTSEFGAASLGPRGGLPAQGGLLVALLNGAFAVVRPVDPADPGLGLANTPAAIAAFATTEELFYLLNSTDDAGLFGTGGDVYWKGAGGTGVVRLEDGSFLISIAQEGRIVRVDGQPDGN